MDPLTWSIILVLCGLALLVLEVFIPSGGLLGFLAVSALLVGVVLAFYHHGPEVGGVFVVVVAVAVPTVLTVAFRWWPHTPMGKRLLLDVPTSEDVMPDTPQRRALKQLVGKVGVAKSKMLPSGVILVAGMTVDATSEGMPIEPGQPVRVIEVRGNHVLVRPADEPATPSGGDDDLSRPIDSLGLDSLNEPLG